MLEHHDELVRTVATALFDGERAIDTAIADLARLPGSIAAVRLQAALPFGTGQGALSDAAEALTLMVRARHHMARAHDRLRQTGADIGITETSFGDVLPCPEMQSLPTADETVMRLVA